MGDYLHCFISKLKHFKIKWLNKEGKFAVLELQVHIITEQKWQNKQNYKKIQ